MFPYPIRLSPFIGVSVGRDHLSKVPGRDFLIGPLIHDPEAALRARHFRNFTGKAARLRRHAQATASVK
ncbi:hypothetical protein SAMN05428963_12534 [Consotaella salsifontis]|uniref:Uncharacterized protein n=1 Tax=Consotaella salsifontis TaxID=1365950 RepID=A0A1T4TDQ5_9HYPH|nr:hypothetical protein SAMN05428963_12534 [Consotaella salsifontis]